MAFRNRRNRSSNRTNVGRQSNFSTVPAPSVPRSLFDRSHGLKTTLGEAGFLYPILVDEALPGDTISCQMTAILRMPTLLNPVMDNVIADVFFFAVPKRILWDNWIYFMGEEKVPGDNRDDQVSYVTPKVAPAASGWAYDSLEDYFGLPPQVASSPNVVAFWHRAYNRIWSDWFRDENLQERPAINTDDGPDDQADYRLLRRGKRHDYFTSCLPWLQKGPDIFLSIGGTAPLVGTSIVQPIGTGSIQPTFTSATGPAAATIEAGQGPPATTGYVHHTGSGVGTPAEPLSWVDPRLESDLSTGSIVPGVLDPYADLSAATGVSLDKFRFSFALQHMLERDARGGTRYVEKIKSFFGVESPDARQQRSEWLGGGSFPVGFTQVPSTTTEAGSSAIGELGAYGFGMGGSRGWVKSFTEHSVILGLVAVRADLNYQNGMNRMWFREVQTDYFWPQLAHLSEQVVFNKEIYLQGTGADDTAFGYQERYAEYRYKPSMITSRMRSQHPTSLDVWHLAQDFASLPTLSAAFIEDDPPIDRVVAVPSEPHFKMDATFAYRCVRPIPVRSIPGLRRM